MMDSDQKKAIAFFDVDGTLLSSTIVHCYLWLRTSNMSPIQRVFWYIGFLPKIVYYLILDRINRSRFNEVFYRNYRGMDVNQVESSAKEMFTSYLQQKVFPDAITQIEDHKEHEDIIALVTGSLDFIVQPIAEYFDVDTVLAAKLKEHDGKFTGELITEPVIGEQKATIMREFAEQNGVSLNDCYAYSDSQSDLPMLQCVGNPIAVNPSKALRQEALTTGWEIHEWMRGS